MVTGAIGGTGIVRASGGTLELGNAIPASDSTAFQIVLWTKVPLFACLLVVSYLHNFVLGPRLQAEIRDGREQRTRPRLVLVGWVSYSLTMALPILGVVLARLVD